MPNANGFSMKLLDYRYRPNEVFKRIKLTTFVQLVTLPFPLPPLNYYAFIIMSNGIFFSSYSVVQFYSVAQNLHRPPNSPQLIYFD